jgi:hypothetical protein
VAGGRYAAIERGRWRAQVQMPERVFDLGQAIIWLVVLFIGAHTTFSKAGRSLARLRRYREATVASGSPATWAIWWKARPA